MTLLDLHTRCAKTIMAALAPSGREARIFIKPNSRLTPLERLDLSDRPSCSFSLRDLGPEMKFGLQPHIRLIEVRYPVDDLRIRVQESSNDPTRVRRIMRPEPIFLAVHRGDFTVFYRRLAEDEFRILEAFERGASIGEAIESVSDAGMIEEWFAAWSRLGWLCQPRN